MVSVKVDTDAEKTFSLRPKPDDFVVNHVSLKYLIQYAYDVEDFQVEGGPDWMNSTKFDVKGKMDLAVGPELDRDARDKLVQARLQTLLSDRFKVRIHRQAKQMPVFGLFVARGGAKLSPVTSEEGYSFGAGMLKSGNATMEFLASVLTTSLQKIVVDETRLKQMFSFQLRWTPEGSGAGDEHFPGLFTALEEQLGLKLVAEKGPVSVVVVDAADRPTKD